MTTDQIKIAISKIDKRAGFELFSLGRKDWDVSFNKGEQERQISVHDFGSGDINVSLTHWSRPTSFVAADRVIIKIQRNYDLLERVLDVLAENFDTIINEFRYHKENGQVSPNGWGGWLSGEVSPITFLSFVNNHLTVTPTE